MGQILCAHIGHGPLVGPVDGPTFGISSFGMDVILLVLRSSNAHTLV